MRQYAGFGTANESNRRYRYLLFRARPASRWLSIFPRRWDFDSDNPMAAGEVGRVGVRISSLADMECLFEGIPLETVSTSMTINSTAAILLAYYALVARRQGANLHKLAGTIQNDILKDTSPAVPIFTRRRPAMRIITTFSPGPAARARWNTISIAATIFGRPVPRRCQDWAFTFANVIAVQLKRRVEPALPNMVAAIEMVFHSGISRRPGKMSMFIVPMRSGRVNIGTRAMYFLQDVF